MRKQLEKAHAKTWIGGMKWWNKRKKS
jgi:hypothetical protein